ncbi:MAG: HAMP domain-containing sensor histidine kinase [Coriobacteriia bacterium]|nr:HAMP domain-containing sensor histidine kinase [Coriobacteriia bacterium]
MLRKLRLKFIALIMAMVTVVVVAVFGLIGAMAYHSSVEAVNESLLQAVDRVERQATAASLGGTALLQAIIEDAQNDQRGQGQGQSQGRGQDDDRFNDRPALPPEIGGKRGGRSTVPVAVYAIDETHNFYLVNQATTASINQEILGSALEQAVGAPDGRGSLPDEGLFFLKKTTSSGESLIAFADQESADGWKPVAVLLFFAGLGTLAIFLIISIFFSRWALRPVEEAWTKQSQFLADASHELKTPLTVIMANTSIAAKDPAATVGSQQKWLDGIQVESQRMQSMINDMLILAKSDAQADESLSLRKSAGAAADLPQIDLSTLAESQILQFESVAFEQSLQVQDEIADGVTVRGDEAKLGRLVTILLDNACKYAAPRTTITLSLATEGGKAKLSVQNFGATIAPEDLPHVFDRFYRTDKARTRAESGSSSHGLGLAIAAGIAQEHGGSIAAASSDADGTTFTVTLPLA